MEAVLHICGNVQSGGVASFVKSVVALNDASNARHDVLLLFGNKGDLNGPNWKTHYLYVERRALMACIRDAMDLVRGYDSIWIHAAHPAVILPLVLNRKHCLLFQHGMTVSSGTLSRRRLKRIWYSVLPWILNARVICSTPYALEKTRALGIHLSTKSVSVVPFGVQSMPGGVRSNRQHERAQIRIGMAGRLEPEKRHDLVIRSLSKYDGRSLIHLRLAGDGTQLAYLQDLARNVRSDKVSIEFLGHVRDMVAFYDEVDLLVFPGANESLGLVVIEALFRGTPVAVFPDVGGCLPLIRNRVTGFVLEPGEPGLRALWQELDRHPQILHEQYRALAEEDLSHFRIERTRSELERLVRTPVA